MLFSRVIGPAMGCGLMICGVLTNKNMCALGIFCGVAGMFFSMMVIGLIEYAAIKFKEK